MSYGFYRLPRTATRVDYINKIAGHLYVPAVVDLHEEHQVAEIQEKVDLGLTWDAPMSSLQPPKVKDTELAASQSKQEGYSGDMCDTCHGFKMRWAGHCQVCENCGTTTGCS